MLKKIICILGTSAIFVGCIALPSFAAGRYDYHVGREGKYFDSQFSERGCIKVSAAESVKTNAHVVLIYKKWKKSINSQSHKKPGSYKLTTAYVYSKDINQVDGNCVLSDTGI